MMNQHAAASLRLRLPLLLAGSVAGAAVAAALVLWAYFGTAVFVEMIVAGVTACF